jgi:4-carboxymuconolactone decarboxylase
MRPSEPRIPPLSLEKFSDEQAAIAGDHARYNFARVMVQHPELYKSFIPFAEQLMRRSSLPAREREILLLRTLALCHESYEAPHHALIARQMGLSDSEITAARAGGDGLTAFEQALLRAAEELVADHCIGDTTWRILAQRYSQSQLMEVVFLVGEYTMSAMATNSFGIPVEDNAEHL